METSLKVLLLVGVVTAASTPPSSPLPSHEVAVLAAVQIYNQEPGTTLAYRLLEAEPQPDWDVSSKTIQSLTFTVKETVCLVSEKRDPSQCEFKEDGLVKDCSGFFSTEQDPPSIIIKCEEASEKMSGLDGFLSAHALITFTPWQLARDYSGYIFPEQQPATNLITCDIVAEEVRKVSTQVTS
ncbi:cathelicidin-related peptide Oh-Cath-like [Gopherus flavomarginatus]|uniref:cathelicidin-related peptide Oh-Cath-like n=1 Tax=Gopherus flavomarginatus TaxID=286002 RepID=UPI0021CBE9AB|nr:cathelicidin-related peptide Oh-Cath-like [Gopherus flavomarginatus]